MTIGVLAVSACGSGAGSDGKSVAVATQQATPPDSALNLDATVHVRLAVEPTSLNPFTTAGVAVDQILLDNVYQGLVGIDTDARDRIVPQLATAWEQTPDGLTYTFHLAPKAAFHDGSALTAADVVWSLQQQIAPGSKALRASSFGAVSEVVAPDPATVVIRLRQRDTMLLWNLAQRGGIVYKSGTDFAALDGTENGSGPFRISQWNRGSTLTLGRVPNYWGSAPKVAGVVFHIIVDTTAANNAELTGQTDIEVATDPTLLSTFADTGRFTVLRGTSTDKYTLAFNETRPALSNPQVRRAIRQAIDKDALITAFGGGTRIGSPVPVQDPWYADLTSIDAYNPDSARKLLAAAGFGSGLQLGLEVPNHYPTALSDILVSDLRAVGVTVTVHPMEFQTWLSKVYRNHDYDLSLVDHAEARDLNIYAQPGYYFGYESTQVQQWYQQALTAESDSARDGLLQQAARRIAEDAPCDWLFLGEGNTVIRKGVFGVPQHETSNRLPATRLAVTK
ncbi:ABC transporter substrate-binding protein [Nocardia panacis]|uniref:ABC transporter substrate-binding protein n=1 Tax=Nocardia panacis TaxID=2340916 RepID=A0A3A4KDP6_9NOCA|nr:ABC transporter substrate-binding protein [Nocardia panacis]RJO71015.1 ABC transporter substrate-binding protein [Nocardia panacis]